jgi:hypothetical protein
MRASGLSPVQVIEAVVQAECRPVSPSYARMRRQAPRYRPAPGLAA